MMLLPYDVRPLGFNDWRVATALISGFTAKEAVVSTLAVLLNTSTANLGAALGTLFTPLSALSFLVFTLLYTPCVAAIATIRRELDSRLKTVGVVVLQCSVAWVVAFCIRAAVGSATAAMLTSIAIAGPVCIASGMSPIIAGLSVCLGANAATFPTDVTFWFPSTYNGLDTKDCIATTTVPCILTGVLGMIALAILNAFTGVLPGMF